MVFTIRSLNFVRRKETRSIRAKSGIKNISEVILVNIKPFTSHITP